MKTAAKITVGITALAAVATVAAMLMFWREVVVQYHCFQLQRDPSYLLRIVEEPVDSLAGVAVREFVRTPGGGKELLMCYTTYVTKHVFPSLGEELETTADIEGVALAYDDKDVFDFELRTSNMSYTGGIWLRGGPDKWSVLEQMQTLFPLVPEVGIVCVANSPYCVRLMRSERVARIFGSNFGEDSDAFPDHVCWIHRHSEEAVASLSADLRSFDATVRRRAVTACIEDPWLGQTVDVAALMAAASTDDSLGDLAFTALVRAGPPAVEPLIQALNTNDRDVQILAARALRRIGSPDAKPAIPALLQCLESKHRWVRSNAMFAISRLGPDPKDLPAFVRLVDDEHPDVRRWAAKAIGALGAAATSAVPRLERALGDESEMVRAAVAEALGAIGRK